jgi:hypothetical protein
LIINAYEAGYQTSLNDYNSSTELRSENTDGSGNYEALIMYNDRHTTDLAHKLKYRVCKNGASKDYAIYGEHNKPKPSDIGAVASSDLVIQTLTTSGTVSPGTEWNPKITVPNGYKPIAIAGFGLSGSASSYANVKTCQIENNTTVEAYVRNTATSTNGEWTFRVRVLCIVE